MSSQKFKKKKKRKEKKKKRKRKLTVALTRYSKTRVSDFSVCMISCNVTMFACRKSRSNETAIETSEFNYYYSSTSTIVEKIKKLNLYFQDKLWSSGSKGNQLQ